MERKDGEGSRIFLIEYDRTGRPDKNLEKLRRYDAFLTWWWRHTSYRDQSPPPWVVFVCQSNDACDRFLAAADLELTGHHWHPSRRAQDDDYVGRSRILFASDCDMHSGDRRTVRVPSFPPRHTTRDFGAEVRHIRLPGL